MNLLFITMSWPNHKTENMYTDMMDEFGKNGHNVCVATLSERRNGVETNLSIENGRRVLRVKCGNIQKTNKYEKVISSFLGGYSLKRNVMKYYKDQSFDLIIFALPPLTITLPLVSLKRKLGCKMYLLLKEFWPQDPADLGAMRIGGMVWKVFSYLEKKLYANSEFIGTMSDAGIRYLQNRDFKVTSYLEVCPNCQSEKHYHPIDEKEKERIRNNFRIPVDSIAFIFGGNLGVSQGIPEMIESIQRCEELEKVFFIIIGDGTEAVFVEESLAKQKNVLFLNRLPQPEYEALLSACDVGLIFLFPKYTVPNIPSRVVTYLMYGLPVIACVDKCTDIGEILMNNHCGISVYNGDYDGFYRSVQTLTDCTTRMEMSEASRKLFLKSYSAEIASKTIMEHFCDGMD